ncbi:alpha/beta hydrolase [Cutibacterium porci]|nr:alpha/beta hydrolase [Cutibacterium porci]
MDPDLLLDSSLREALRTVPPQECWNPGPMRASGAALLDAAPADHSGVDLAVHHINDDAGLEVRVLTPAASPRPHALILSVHGGGLVAGRARYDDAWNAEISRRTGAIVISPEYRLAPEYPYPAALDDCLEAWTWALHEFNPSMSLIYGDSAGGNLAAGLALRLRDQGAIGAVDALFLIEPVLDDRLDTPSMRAGINTPVWDLPNARASWAAYLGPGQADRYAAPARATELSGLPEVFLLVNQCDPLRDEGIRFAQNLTDSNVPTELAMLAKSCHGVLGMAGVGIADRAREMVLGKLRESLDTIRRRKGGIVD